MKKVAIVVAGAGACGKTTTTQAFVIGNPEIHIEPREALMRHGMQLANAVWSLYENCGVAGNHKSGTDSNTGPGIVKAAFEEVLKERDIVIVDGMVSSPRWVTMCTDWQERHPIDELIMVLLYYQITPEEVLSRLAHRREVEIESIRAKMMPKCLGLTRRAELLVEHVDELWHGDLYQIDIFDDDSTDIIVDAVDETLCEIFGDCDD